MKLTGEKNIVSLLKRSFAKVYPKDPQTESPKKSPLRHLKITKLKINYTKDFGTEKQVIHYCTKYLKDFPTSYKTFCDRAEAYFKLKKYSRAINDLNSAILLKPERPTACKAIRIDPINCFALKSRAYCYYQLNSLEETLCDLNMVIILGCSDENTRINKANILRELKEKNNSAKEDLRNDSNNGASLKSDEPTFMLSENHGNVLLLELFNSGNNWQHWTILDNAGKYWTTLENTGRCWTMLGNRNKTGQRWTMLGIARQVWTTLGEDNTTICHSL
ncbi:hypothetical protein Glove_57g77 [Diversispora epigaea]|uniref:Uncharacterized protein n=1 Tax=Diversispora epigaea TaxID=1348612 RepID=A0A397JD53_9GLOM|nr:hypothetical protein Glove_57g77 [Diversispora epigaea]